MAEEMFTYTELIARLRVSRRFAERRVVAGEWPCHRFGRSVRFTEADVAQIVELAAQPASSVIDLLGSSRLPVSRAEQQARMRQIKASRQLGRTGS